MINETSNESMVSNNNDDNNNYSVRVQHYIIKHWAPGELLQGPIKCNISCVWMSAEHLRPLRHNIESKEKNHTVIDVGLYNIHSLWEKTRSHFPNNCDLPVNITMAESEESFTRYNHVFEPSFVNFDGVSTTSPVASVQRVYEDAFMPDRNFLSTIHNFTSLIKAASYIASDCHRRDSANANRDGVVQKLRENGFRVDGLGRCMRQIGPEGVTMPMSPETRYNLVIKREIIAKFMFHLAFENSIEDGYVTEKPFDALVAGTVPVYLGDSKHLRSLLPHPKAVIFVSDFQDDYTALAKYLNYLMTNESAYEELRQWRSTYNYDEHRKDKPLLQDSWPCRVCQWAANSYTHNHTYYSTRQLVDLNACETVGPARKYDVHNGQAVRGNSRDVFLLQNGTLHHIPNLDTFNYLKLELEKIKVLSDSEIKKFKKGHPIPDMSQNV